MLEPPNANCNYRKLYKRSGYGSQKRKTQKKCFKLCKYWVLQKRLMLYFTFLRTGFLERHLYCIFIGDTNEFLSKNWNQDIPERSRSKTGLVQTPDTSSLSIILVISGLGQSNKLSKLQLWQIRTFLSSSNIRNDSNLENNFYIVTNGPN